jgi:hypothetical protein
VAEYPEVMNDFVQNVDTFVKPMGRGKKNPASEAGFGRKVGLTELPMED